MSDPLQIPWRLDVGVHTDVGRVRRGNEDAAKVSSDPPLYAVADGMGGHLAGERASRLAVEALHELVGSATQEETVPPGPELLRKAFIGANQRILEDAAAHPERRGMGTTLTALLLAGDDYWIGHVGDSRALLIRDGEIEQVTRDHSVVANQVRNGEISVEEARSHPLRHVLDRCLGLEPDPQVDVEHGAVHDGDVFILASDGLTGAVGPETILETVAAASSAADASRRLVELARRLDGRDNITAVVVACRTP